MVFIYINLYQVYYTVSCVILDDKTPIDSWLIYFNLGCEVGQYGDYCKCCDGCQECDIENGKCSMLTFNQTHFKICV